MIPVGNDLTLSVTIQDRDAVDGGGKTPASMGADHGPGQKDALAGLSGFAGGHIHLKAVDELQGPLAKGVQTMGGLHGIAKDYIWCINRGQSA